MTRRSPRSLLALVGLLSLLALLGCTSTPPEEPESSLYWERDGSTAAEPEPLVTGLQAPWSLTFYDGVALVSERDTARILEIAADGEVREVGIVPGVTPGGEGGLLGIAAHETSLYVYATTADGNRVARFPLTGSAGSLGLGEPEPILTGIPAAGNHNGGRLAFGPDGMLYVTTGDAGQPALAQDLDSLAGKILRLTPDGGVPADNPISGSPVFSYGHRNPQGIAWAADGTMYASEFGQNTWDELNVIVGGCNYGWPAVEGIADRSGFIDPILQWSPEDASPSGIAVRGGRIYVANLRGERLRVVTIANPNSPVNRDLVGYGRLRDAVVTPDGELWVLTNNTDGRGEPGPDDDRILVVPTG